MGFDFKAIVNTMEKQVAAKQAQSAPKPSGGGSSQRPAEDNPNWKWYQNGNRTASAPYAMKHPPPKGWGAAYAGKNAKGHTLYRALKPKQVKAEDDIWDRKTRQPAWKNTQAQNRVRKSPSYRRGDDTDRGA